MTINDKILISKILMGDNDDDNGFEYWLSMSMIMMMIMICIYDNDILPLIW